MTDHAFFGKTANGNSIFRTATLCRSACFALFTALTHQLTNRIPFLLPDSRDFLKKTSGAVQKHHLPSFFSGCAPFFRPVRGRPRAYNKGISGSRNGGRGRRLRVRRERDLPSDSLPQSQRRLNSGGVSGSVHGLFRRNRAECTHGGAEQGVPIRENIDETEVGPVNGHAGRNSQGDIMSGPPVRPGLQDSPADSRMSPATRQRERTPAARGPAGTTPPRHATPVRRNNAHTPTPRVPERRVWADGK